MRLVEQPEGEVGERYVLCRSQARAEKERAMLRRQSERLSEELIKVDAWLRRSPQSDHEAVGRRIGRHLGKNPAASAIIDAQVLRDGQGLACALRISSRLDAGQKAHREKGAYLLRTNCEETDRPGVVVEMVHPAHPGRGRVPHRQKRPRAATGLSPQGRPGAGAHPGVFPRAGAVANAGAMDAAKGPGQLRPPVG